MTMPATPTRAAWVISAAIRSTSSAVSMYPPPRGRISTCTPIPTATTCSMVANVGLSPPMPSALHSSTRSAPFSRAILAPAASCTAISSLVVGFRVARAEPSGAPSVRADASGGNHFGVHGRGSSNLLSVFSAKRSAPSGKGGMAMTPAVRTESGLPSEACASLRYPAPWVGRPGTDDFGLMIRGRITNRKTTANITDPPMSAPSTHP
jgi:hypothetical protein